MKTDMKVNSTSLSNQTCIPNYSRLKLSSGPLSCRWRGPPGAEVFSHYSYFAVVLYGILLSLLWKMHGHTACWVTVWFLSSLKALVNLSQLKSLNYLRLNPNLIEQILALFHVKSCHLSHMVHAVVYVGAKSNYCCFSNAYGNHKISCDAEPSERKIHSYISMSFHGWST